MYAPVQDAGRGAQKHAKTRFVTEVRSGFEAQPACGSGQMQAVIKSYQDVRIDTVAILCWLGGPARCCGLAYPKLQNPGWR
jgi:hypothetical protein